MSPFKNVEAMISGGTIPGLSLNLETWIRNDWTTPFPMRAGDVGYK